MNRAILFGGLAALGLGLGAVVLGSSSSGRVIEIDASNARQLMTLSDKVVIVVYDSPRVRDSLGTASAGEFDLVFVPFDVARTWAPGSARLALADLTQRNVLVAVDTTGERSISLPATAANVPIAAAWLRQGART